ncbi:MAG TPA: hypothetical protein DEH25_11985 [Chloroflexi bacterium]|nr:hypothetical protein [Chloroflexota bacterium]HBY08248.1 hypothetical protein [Chloroflexota bacterium]
MIQLERFVDILPEALVNQIIGKHSFGNHLLPKELTFKRKRMKPTKIFETEVWIDADPVDVRNFLADLSHHDQIHPLIVQVEELTPPEVDFRRYQITDRVPVGPFTMKAVYEADIRISPAGDVISEARQSPGIRLQNVTQCIPSNGGTRLVEKVTVSAPRLLLGFVTQQAQESHEGMFSRLKIWLEQQKSAETAVNI